MPDNANDYSDLLSAHKRILDSIPRIQDEAIESGDFTKVKAANDALTRLNAVTQHVADQNNINVGETGEDTPAPVAPPPKPEQIPVTDENGNRLDKPYGPKMLSAGDTSLIAIPRALSPQKKEAIATAAAANVKAAAEHADEQQGFKIQDFTRPDTEVPTTKYATGKPNILTEDPNDTEAESGGKGYDAPNSEPKLNPALAANYENFRRQKAGLPPLDSNGDEPVQAATRKLKDALGSDSNDPNELIQQAKEKYGPGNGIIGKVFARKVDTTPLGEWYSGKESDAPVGETRYGNLLSGRNTTGAQSDDWTNPEVGELTRQLEIERYIDARNKGKSPNAIPTSEIRGEKKDPATGQFIPMPAAPGSNFNPNYARDVAPAPTGGAQSMEDMRKQAEALFPTPGPTTMTDTLSAAREAVGVRPSAEEAINKVGGPTPTPPPQSPEAKAKFEADMKRLDIPLTLEDTYKKHPELLAERNALANPPTPGHGNYDANESPALLTSTPKEQPAPSGGQPKNPWAGYMDDNGNISVAKMMADINKNLPKPDYNEFRRRVQQELGDKPNPSIWNVVSAFFAGLGRSEAGIKISNQWHDDAVRWQEDKARIGQEMNSKADQQAQFATHLLTSALGTQQSMSQHQQSLDETKRAHDLENARAKASLDAMTARHAEDLIQRYASQLASTQDRAAQRKIAYLMLQERAVRDSMSNNTLGREAGDFVRDIMNKVGINPQSAQNEAQQRIPNQNNP